MINDLNKAVIEADTRYHPEVPFQDFGVEAENGDIAVYFRNIESHLLRLIEEADIVLGCVAWLTSARILEALSRKMGVSIIVQKEDFLRPDLGAKGDWKGKIHQLYSNLPSNLSQYDGGFIGTPLHMLSFATDPTIEAVRCVGNHNVDKKPAFPRAHHKFVVFCKKNEQGVSAYGGDFTPYAVWTGSFNFTWNAGNSLENAVVLRNQEIVSSFLKEYAQIACISESLNWDSAWSAPDWRVGT